MVVSILKEGKLILLGESGRLIWEAGWGMNVVNQTVKEKYREEWKGRETGTIPEDKTLEKTIIQGKVKEKKSTKKIEKEEL